MSHVVARGLLHARDRADPEHDAPDTAARVVTCSPDVASTELRGWLDKTGVWSSVQDRRDRFADDAELG